MTQDEILDIVSYTDEIIGQEKRSIIYEKKLSSFRVINGLICNSEKKLWIPRRHHEKKLFPLHLDVSVGGHVAAGETYQQAFERESFEELRIDVAHYTYAMVAQLTPHQHNTSAFMHVYIIRSDKTPDYNREDFVEAEWLTIDEIYHRLRNGDKAKSDLLPIINAIKDLL